MNQILFNKKDNKKKYIFKVQAVISIFLAAIFIFDIIMNYNNNENLENISKIIEKNIRLNSIYETEKQSNTSSYFGKIYIEKINLEYAVFNRLTDELLKISPCKFYGNNMEEKGNICIAGHNYNDDRFFGKIDELELKDKIALYDLQGEKYEYIVFDIFETDENDTSVLENTKNYELTLVTCNNSNKKRVIVKAYRKEF
ncbi:MAG TPA: sortase [Candidatus Scatovivens faecipullorum]|nr:sortase [Candidatus Scatovivens faecipullorum]